MPRWIEGQGGAYAPGCGGNISSPSFWIVKLGCCWEVQEKTTLGSALPSSTPFNWWLQGWEHHIPHCRRGRRGFFVEIVLRPNAWQKALKFSPQFFLHFVKLSSPWPKAAFCQVSSPRSKFFGIVALSGTPIVWSFPHIDSQHNFHIWQFQSMSSLIWDQEGVCEPHIVEGPHQGLL